MIKFEVYRKENDESKIMLESDYTNANVLEVLTIMTDLYDNLKLIGFTKEMVDEAFEEFYAKKSKYEIKNERKEK